MMEKTLKATATVDGKKKFTATLVSIAASLVGLFFTPDTAEPLTQAIAVAGPSPSSRSAPSWCG